MSDFWNTRLILKTYAGSHSYGTNIKESDEDFRGVCIPPKNYLLGLDRFEQMESNDPDEVIYSLKKFARLALQSNPNILDVLFVENNHIVFINTFGEELRNLRYDFLSKRVYKTYGGYAYSQLKKMVTVGKDATGKRLADIKKYGYDTKNAYHLIRLLRMGIEALTDGEVYVLRHDNQELLKIRRGEYPLSYIESEAMRLRNLLDEAYVNSKLPVKPNYDKINTRLIDIQERGLKWKGNQ